MKPLATLLGISVLVACPRIAAADAYDDAFTRASGAERRGDLAGAARALVAQVDAYPQDYAIALALGWTYFRAGRYADAERAYRTASDRAPASDDARLGLAWSLVREGRCDEATTRLRALLGSREAPDARQSLAECDAGNDPASPAPPARWALSAAWNEFLFPSHPYKSNGTGVVASASGTIGSGWVFGGAYRYVRFATESTSILAPFSQNEGYVDAGYARPSFAVMARGALVADGTGAYGTSTHVGASGRWSPLGDVLLDAAVSVYPDLTVARVAPRWRIPVLGPFSVMPGVAGQRAGGASFANAQLTLLLDTRRASFWLGGKFGDEVRPAYLDAHVVYDVPERVAWGAWAGARVKLVSAVGLSATYALDRIRRTDALTPNQSNVHAVSFGPFVEF